MSDVVVQEVPTEKIVKASSRREKISCERCGSEKMHRVFREGFLQQHIYPFFGYFPWRCKTCGNLALMHKRHRGRAHEGETYTQGKASR